MSTESDSLDVFDSFRPFFALTIIIGLTDVGYFSVFGEESAAYAS